MKYDLYFNHLRNVGYVFKFNSEFRKVYDLYFKYIPVYEIFIHVLKDVEISRQADKIKPASFLYGFIDALGIKSKKVDDILIEILKDYKSTYELSQLLDSGKKEIINISKQFLQDLELLSKNGVIITDDSTSSIIHEINNEKKLLELNKPQDIDINVIKNKQADATMINIHPNKILELEIDRSTDTINFNTLRSTIDYLFNEISKTWNLKTLENSQENEVKQLKRKNVDFNKKGKLLEDNQININKDIIINHSPIVEVDHYRDDIVYTHFFIKMLETYYREIKTGFKHGLEAHGNELNNLYKNYLYDTVHDLSYFISHKDIEYDESRIRKIQCYTYSTFGSDIIVNKTIPVEFDLIEIKDGQYYQVDYHKKGKILDETLVDIRHEITEQELQDAISLEKESITYTIRTIDIANENTINYSAKQIELGSGNIVNNSIKRIELGNEDTINSSIKQIELGNDSVSKHLIGQIEFGNEEIPNTHLKDVTKVDLEISIESNSDISTYDMDTYKKHSIIVNTSDLDTYHANILHWIDSSYEAYHHEYKSSDSLKSRGKIVEEDWVNIQRELNIQSLLDAETANINIEIGNLKAVAKLGSDIIITSTQGVNVFSDEIKASSVQIIDNSLGEIFNNGVLNVHAEKVAKMFDGHEEFSIIKDLTGIILHTPTLADQPSSDIKIETLGNVDAYDNDIAIHKIITMGKTNKYFDDYTGNNLNIPLVEIIVNKPIYADKGNKILDCYNDNNIITSDLEIIINQYDFAEKIQKLMDDHRDHSIIIESGEMDKYKSVFIEKNEKQFDGYNDNYFVGESLQILIENILDVEKTNKYFDSYNDNYFTSNNRDIIIINSKSTERISNQFDNYSDDYYFKQNVDIFIYHQNDLIESLNKQFDYYDVSFLTENKSENIKIPQQYIEITFKEFDEYDTNQISANTFNTYIFKNISLEKFENEFFIIDINNENISPMEISKHTFLIVESKDKEFITSLDDKNLILSEENMIKYFSKLIETRNKAFDNYESDDINLIETEIYQNKKDFIEKVYNQFDEYNVQWNAALPINLQKNINIYIEKGNKQLDNYDASLIHFDYLESIDGEFLHSTEFIGRIFDEYVDETTNINQLEVKVTNQIIIAKQEKEFDYDEIKNLILGQNNILISINKTAEQNEKRFDDYKEEYLLPSTVDTIVISSNHIEKQKNEFDDFDINNLLMRGNDINKFVTVSTEKINKQLDNYDTEDLSFKINEIDGWEIGYLEKINKSFDDYDNNFTVIGVKEYIKPPLIYMEKISKEFDNYDIDQVVLRNLDIYKSEIALLEKLKNEFFIIDIENQSANKIDISNQIFLIVESKNKEFVTSLDDKDLSLSTENIIKYISDMVEIRTKEFNDYQDDNINLTNIDVYQNKRDLVEKLNNQLDSYDIEWHIITPADLQKNNSKNVEKNNRLLEDYDISLNNKEYSEIIIERLPYLAETVSKMFDHYIDSEVGIEKSEAEIINQIVLVKKEKELDYDVIENVILGQSDILFPGITIVEKTKKILDDFAENHLESPITDIVIIPSLQVEKQVHEFEEFNEGNIRTKNNDINKFISSLVEKTNKELDDQDIKDLSQGINEINDWTLQRFEKTNKILDEYYINDLQSLNIEIDKSRPEFIEKDGKIFNDYDLNNVDSGNININNWNILWLEKNNKVLNLIKEDYQSNLGSEIIIVPNKNLEKSTKEFDDNDFNITNGGNIEIININQDLLEKSQKEFDDYYLKYLPKDSIIIQKQEEGFTEKSKKEFDNFTDKAMGLTATQIDKNLFDSLEKLRKEFNNYSDKYTSDDKIQITKLNADDLEKGKKEFDSFFDKQLSSGNYGVVVLSQNDLEKKSKELETYDLGQGGRGSIDIYDHNPTSPNIGWLTKKEKELEEFNDKHLHRVAIEIAHNMAENETNPHRTLEEALIEIIGSNNIKSRSDLSVEDVFVEVVTDSHKKFFDTTFVETLNKMYSNHLEMFKSEIGKNKYKNSETFKDQIGKHNFQYVEIPKNETIKHNNKRIEIKSVEILNKLIKHLKTIEFKPSESRKSSIQAVDYPQQEVWSKQLQFTTKMQFLIQTSKFNGVTKKAFDTWKSFKDAILNNRQVLEVKHQTAEENERKSEIHDMTDEVLDWITKAKIEAALHSTTSIEQDVFADEIEEINPVDFTNTGKREIIRHKHKDYEQYDDDEIEEFNEIDFVTYDKLEATLHTTKTPVDETFNDEIEEINTIVHVTREKVEALVHTQKLIDKMKMDTNSRSLQNGVELMRKDDKIYKPDWIEIKNNLEANITHIKDLELGTREVIHKHSNGAETGKRGFDPRLEDWWSQDWVHLTERKTPIGEVIELREEAIRDFKNFMDRCISYKDPISGEELDELVYRWSVNTDYNPDYVNEIEHFYYLIHTKLGKNHDYTKGQLELITNIIIGNYKKFYVDEFKKYHFELVDPNEEVRIHLRAMLHFYMFLEQLIDANQGYLKTSTVQEGIDLIKKILREWIESETSYFEPTEEELIHLDPWMVNRLRENLPQDYNYMVRWFEWYCKEEEFIYGHNFEKDGFTAVSNIRDKMISYFNTHWGVRRTSYMDELDKSQIEIENARKLLDNGVDPQGRQLAMAMMKAVNLIKPSVFIDTSIVDKIRGMMHGKVNRTNKKFNINGLGTIQRSSLMGWKGMNKHDKNQTNTWTSQNNERYANLKDSYNIDQHSLIVNPDYNKMIYNIVKIEKIEE